MFDTLGTALPPVKARVVAGARGQFGRAHRRSARCADHRRERLSRLSRQRLVWHRRAGQGARRRSCRRSPPASNRALNDEAFRASLDKVGFSPLRPQQPGGDREVHRGRPRAMGRCRSRSTQHLTGLERIDMVRENEVREGEIAVDMPPAQRCRPGLHRPHPHALELAAGDAAAGPSRRPGLPARNFRALGARDQGRRFLLRISK